jgi:hypothetical protein
VARAYYTIHLVLNEEQREYLEVQAVERMLSMSALIRELIDRDQANRERTKRRRQTRR